MSVKGEIYFLTKKLQVDVVRSNSVQTGVRVYFETEDGLLVNVVASEMTVTADVVQWT